jgi:hypothetical protein
MTCVHFQSNVPATGELALAVSSPRLDACGLLLPHEARREHYSAGLQAAGLKQAHRFACPVAAGGRWKLCPFFEKPGRRVRRRR